MRTVKVTLLVGRCEVRHTGRKILNGGRWEACRKLKLVEVDGEGEVL